MPVKKISDAPANIRELDGVKLTLGQINSILETYDAIKDDDDVDSPMAVAIAQFKKTHHVSGDKWVKNKKSGEAAASMIDIDNLDKYIVIQTGGVSVDDVEDLREFDHDFGHGIYALFSDEQESIIAFAFEPTVWDEQTAGAWVKEAKKKNFSATQFLATVWKFAMSLVGASTDQSKPKFARGYQETREILEKALEERYATRDPKTDVVHYPWVIDFGPTTVIFEMDGEELVGTYTIGEDDEVIISDVEKAEKGWKREDGSPIVLHSFDVHLGSGEEAEPDEDDGLIWKEIIHPGKWFKVDTGRIIEITKEIIEAAYEAWEAGFPKYISVPTDSHHEDAGGDVPPESNRGFVRKLKMIGDRLFGGFQFTDPEVAYDVQVGNIADCSVSLIPNLIHPETGDKLPWVLQHVLLTNDPLVQDLAPFGVAASSAEGQAVVVSYQTYEEASDMAKKDEHTQDTPAPDAVQLSAEDKATLEALRGLNLTADEIRTMADERQAVRKKARDLEITRIIRAMEGKEAHEGVTQVEGYRHAPAICAAVEKVLKEQPEALSLSANDEGGTGLDAVVLEIVNAIPEEGRVKLSLGSGDEEPAGNRLPEDGDETLQAGDKEPTDEQIDALEEELGL
jgi:hypothetical protein